MASRFASKDVFEQAVAALGLPVAGDEVDVLWQMVVDLQEEVERLRRWVQEWVGPGLHGDLGHSQM